MRPDPAKKIDTRGKQSPLAGLGNAFAGMNLPDLPEGKSEAPSAGKPAANPAPLWKPGRVILRKETAHRGGKTVIIIDDFATHLPISLIERLAKKIRAACGCGGTVKDRRIEIQGDHPAKIRTLLESEGFQVGGVR
jgi:translation initiation factor 1